MDEDPATPEPRCPKIPSVPSQSGETDRRSRLGLAPPPEQLRGRPRNAGAEPSPNSTEAGACRDVQSSGGYSYITPNWYETLSDFPEPGILFKDITPVLADRRAFTRLIDDLAEPFVGRVDKVAGIEARGFILATPVAEELRTGFIPIRKPGKLPWNVVREDYELEYGTRCPRDPRRCRRTRRPGAGG